jgi:hypothetical protein
METGMRIRDTGRCLLMAMLLMVTMNGHAQQTDPALTAAVTAPDFGNASPKILFQVE